MDEPSNESDTTEYLLTTVDNPFDPFTQWDEWFVWDSNAGYHTPGLLARIAQVGDDLPIGQQELAIRQAIDEIVEENVSGMHMKVARGDVELRARQQV